MLCGEIGDWSQRIQSSGTGGPRGPDQQKRQIPGGAILSQQPVEPIDIESQLVVYADQAQRVAAEAGDVSDLDPRKVALGRRVEHGLGRKRAESLGGVRRERSGQCQQHGGEVGLSTAGGDVARQVAGGQLEARGDEASGRVVRPRQRRAHVTTRPAAG